MLWLFRIDCLLSPTCSVNSINLYTSLKCNDSTKHTTDTCFSLLLLDLHLDI